MRDDAPQSTRNRFFGVFTSTQVWKRPPLPNASPLPRNLIFTLSTRGYCCDPISRSDTHNPVPCSLQPQVFPSLLQPACTSNPDRSCIQTTLRIARIQRLLAVSTHRLAGVGEMGLLVLLLPTSNATAMTATSPIAPNIIHSVAVLIGRPGDF